MREQNHLLQRQLANALDMCTAILSKMERGERKAKREHISLLASLLHSNERELFTIWLADQIYEIIKEESNPSKILQVVEKEIKIAKCLP